MKKILDLLISYFGQKIICLCFIKGPESWLHRALLMTKTKYQDQIRVVLVVLQLVHSRKMDRRKLLHIALVLHWKKVACMWPNKLSSTSKKELYH